MTVGYLVSAEKCPECKKMALFPFSRFVEDGEKKYGVLSMRCHECGWTTDEKEDLKRFKKWLSAQIYEEILEEEKELVKELKKVS